MVHGAIGRNNNHPRGCDCLACQQNVNSTGISTLISHSSNTSIPSLAPPAQPTFSFEPFGVEPISLQLNRLEEKLDRLLELMTHQQQPIRLGGT